MLLSGLLITGCVKENSSACPTIYFLNVKAYTTVGGADAMEDVNDVVLYLFDGNGFFIEEIATTVGLSVPIGIPPNQSATIIAWGNLLEEKQARPALNVGDHIYSCSVDLIAASRASKFCLSPGDLFYGVLTLTKNDRMGSKIIPIYRCTGKMTITINGWESCFPDVASEDLSIAVGESYGSLDFSCAGRGDKISLSPRGSSNGSDEYYVPPFNMFQCDNLTMVVTAPGYSPVMVGRDDNGRNLSVAAGETTNVLLDLRFPVSVSVRTTDWRTVAVWKDF